MVSQSRLGSEDLVYPKKTNISIAVRTVFRPIRMILSMAENVRPGKILRELIIIPVLVQPLPEYRDIDRQKKSFVSSFCNR